MRILHVLDHSLPLHSGYSFRTQAIIDAQRARGWETAQLTSAKQGIAGAADEEIDGCLYHRSPAPHPLAARLPVVNQWGVVAALERRLDELIPRLRPDVIHAHSPALTGVAALRAGRRAGVPVVYECRAFWEDAAVDHGTSKPGGLRYRLTRALETWVCRRADAVTTICEGIRGELAERGLPRERITVIPNAVDPAQFRPGQRDAALARALGLEGRTVLGFIGSFYGYEGIDLAIDALPKIAAHVPDVALLLVGGGFQEEALRARAAALGPGHKVVFTGRVPHADVGRYYDLIDLLVYPRRSIRLTELVTPLKPLEAMAGRRLFIASDVGGHRELIEDGVTGTLFRAGDADALADAAVALLRDHAGHAARLAAARAYVERERTWTASVARYAPVYERLIATRGGARAGAPARA
jgi:PEP-CTERM/exosortase A-associated glycosyltransferase